MMTRNARPAAAADVRRPAAAPAADDAAAIAAVQAELRSVRWVSGLEITGGRMQ